MKLQDVSLKNIIVNTNQPRKNFEEEKLIELKESIKNNGLIQPIILRKMSNNKYEIVAGERRFRAVSMLGMETIKAIIIEAGNSKSYEYALLENIQRENLNVIEEAQGYLMLMEIYGYNQEELSVKLGKTRVSISNKIRLLKLPEKIKEYVKIGTLSYGQARALLGIKYDKDIEDLAEKIIQRGYSVRKVEQIVKKYNECEDEKTKIFRDERKENFNLESYKEEDEEKTFLEGKLKDFFGTKVILKGDLVEGGKIEIDFYDYEDLSRIIELFNINFD